MSLPRFTIALLLCAAGLSAAEGLGIVRFGGLPLPGAQVIASQGEKRFTAVTAEDGAYLFKDLPDGVWSERVEMLGFAPAEQEVSVGPGAPGPVWDLKILSFDEIKAMAPPAEPESAPAPVLSVTTAAPDKGGKKPASKAPSKPGFRKTEVAAVAPPAQQAEPVAQADSSDSFAINGSANNSGASAFALSPAFGNARRGAGSLYNGTLGFAMGNSALDARPFSLTGQNTPKAAYNHIQGNVAVGGPLRIPHYFQGNNPINFFVAYQFTRNRNADTVPYLVPTEDQRNGMVAPGVVVPKSEISPQAASLLRFYPLPNFSGDSRYNYQKNIRSTANSDNLQSRISRSLNRSTQAFGTFAWQRASDDAWNLFDFVDANHTSGIDVTANVTHRFSQRVFATFKYQFNRLSTGLDPFFAGVENVSGEAGVAGNLQDPLNWGPPSLNFSGGVASLSDGLEYFNRSQTHALGFNMYVSHSPHNITMGADYKRQQFNDLGQQNPRGDFTFAGGAGADFAKFLRGVPDASSIAFGNADKYFRANLYDGYITDDWRVNPSFTLNVGVRWEYNSPISEKYGRLVNLDIAGGYSAVTPVAARDATHDLLHPFRLGFQPRVGISWRPVSGSSMVVRAGYGITRDTSVYQSIATRMAQQAPLSYSLAVQNTPDTPLTLANGFIMSSRTTPTTFAVDPEFKPGYAQSWQLQIQRDLPASLVVTATYLGIKGTRAQQIFLPNTFPNGSIPPAGYALLTSNGNSTKETGQIQLRRRLRAGLTATLQYTYSKAIDDAALGGRGQGGQFIAQNWLDLSADRGLSNFDQRHLLNFQMQYTLKQWTFTSQLTAGTGFPLSPLVLAPVNGTGVTGTLRPDYLGGDPLSPLSYQVAVGHWGNAGRNSIRGPEQFTLDSSLGRAIRVRDKWDTELRVSAVNALNHVTYTTYNTVVGNEQFGLPVRANPMRSLQAILRARF